MKQHANRQTYSIACFPFICFTRGGPLLFAQDKHEATRRPANLFICLCPFHLFYQRRSMFLDMKQHANRQTYSFACVPFICFFQRRLIFCLHKISMKQHATRQTYSFACFSFICFTRGGPLFYRQINMKQNANRQTYAFVGQHTHEAARQPANLFICLLPFHLFYQRGSIFCTR